MLSDESTIFFWRKKYDERSALVNRVVEQHLYSVRDKQIKKSLFKVRMDLDIRRNGSIYTRTRNGKKSPSAGGRGPGTRPAGLLAVVLDHLHHPHGLIPVL